MQALSRSGKAEVLMNSHRPMEITKFLFKKSEESEKLVDGCLFLYLATIFSRNSFAETSQYPVLLGMLVLRPKRSSRFIFLFPGKFSKC